MVKGDMRRIVSALAGLSTHDLEEILTSYE